MENKKNILVICEGNFDADLLERILKFYPLSLNYKIYPYKTNIHLLNQHLKKYYSESDLSLTTIDIIQVLKEFRNNEILSYKYTDILLIFDFDPQDPRYDPKALFILQSVFSESTNQGQLYLNYPMAEAAFDFKQLPDPDFLDRKINFKFLKFSGYKNLVKDYSCLHVLNGLNEKSIPIILNHTYTKFKSITPINEEKYIELLKAECLLLADSQMIDVLNTCLMFLYDYNPSYFLSFSYNE